MQVWDYLSQEAAAGWESLQEFDIGLDKRVRHEAWQKAEQIYAQLQEEGISLLLYGSEDYPPSFKLLQSQAPLLLSTKGNKALLKTTQGIAIIGTRTPSLEGSRASYRIAQSEIQKGHCIVSGLATGCDTQAHQAAVDQHKPTIACLPSPIDGLYPAENQALAQAIIETGGCLLSEYLPGQPIRKRNFLERDKHQALLAQKVILVESKRKGGAMHTMRYAKRWKRHTALYQPQDNTLWKSEQYEGNRRFLNQYPNTPLIED